MGPDAARLVTWVEAGTEPAFALEKGSLRGHARAKPLAGPLAQALSRLAAYLGLAPATLARPITHDELRRAASSPEGVDTIAAVFERALEGSLCAGSRRVVAEVGGEATLDRRLRLVEVADPGRALVARVAEAGDDACALARLFLEEPGMTRLDDARVLRGVVQRAEPCDGLDASGRAVLRQAARTVVENALARLDLTPEAQTLAIVDHDWRGRYVGRWHTHGPHVTADGLRGGEGPSFEDLHNAVRDGQFLTITFQPDGFDLHDAAGIAEPDLRQVETIRHRSRGWTERFGRARRALPACPAPQPSQ